MGKLFGTDGIRGVAGEYPLDGKTLFRIGSELGQFLVENHTTAHVVIGRDTRASGVWIEEIIRQSLAQAGVKSDLAGVFTTPGVSFLARTSNYQAGVVISASHNPFRDNGIKMFAHTGMKISDEAENEIEERVFRSRAAAENSPSEPLITRLLTVNEPLMHSYLDFLRTAADHPSRRFKIVLDCANGASFRLAPKLFQSLGHEVVILYNQPDGTNINAKCGALHPQALCRAVVEHGADLGVAFDGDADRSIFSDERGQVVDGDHILYIFARFLKEREGLRNDTVVATLMSNIGLEIALSKLSIRLDRAKVGDRYVLERMLELGANLGGEQSGHILLLDQSVAGDGLLTTVQLLRVMQQTGLALSALATPVPKFPQILINVSVSSKPELSTVPAIHSAVTEVRSRLGDDGRVLVRYSGTESIARVMIEGREEEMVRDCARQIASVIQNEIG
ncbi:MAG TPA: phosphoglucosamine mutase [Acidobacteriota bacterium]